LNTYFKTKPYLPTLVVSVILFIMVFLPWATVSVMGFSASANGTGHGGGVLTLIMSIVGAGASFLINQKYRVWGTIGAGVLALLGVILAWAGLGGAGVGFGLIIALIAALGLIYVGYMDYRKLNPPAKPSQPPPANPPAPPPAPPKQ